MELLLCPAGSLRRGRFVSGFGNTLAILSGRRDFEDVSKMMPGHSESEKAHMQVDDITIAIYMKFVGNLPLREDLELFA
jgi:hypothetical protein